MMPTTRGVGTCLAYWEARRRASRGGRNDLAVAVRGRRPVARPPGPGARPGRPPNEPPVRGRLPGSPVRGRALPPVPATPGGEARCLGDDRPDGRRGGRGAHVRQLGTLRDRPQRPRDGPLLPAGRSPAPVQPADPPRDLATGPGVRGQALPRPGPPPRELRAHLAALSLGTGPQRGGQRCVLPLGEPAVDLGGVPAGAHGRAGGAGPPAGPRRARRGVRLQPGLGSSPTCSWRSSHSTSAAPRSRGATPPASCGRASSPSPTGARWRPEGSPWTGSRDSGPPAIPPAMPTCAGPRECLCSTHGTTCACRSGSPWRCGGPLASQRSGGSRAGHITGFLFRDTIVAEVLAALGLPRPVQASRRLGLPWRVEPAAQRIRWAS
jgi:hypothetical protein